MIIVTFEKENGMYTYCKIEGHAGFGEFGKDIICSAVSSVAQATVIGIIEVLGMNIDFSIEPGNCIIDLKNLEIDKINDCQILMKTLFKSLKRIEESGYKNYLEVVHK